MAINFQAISDALANDMNNMHSQEITTFQNNQPYMENPQGIPPPRQDDFRAYNNYYTNDYTSGYEFFVQGQQYGYPSYSGGMHVTHHGFTQWAGFTTTTPSTAATRNPTAHTVNTIRHVNSLRTMQQDGTVYEQHTNFEVQAEMDGHGNCVGILGWQWDDAVASNVDDGNQGLAESRAYTPQEYDGVQDNYGRTWESTSTSNNTSTEQVEDDKKLNKSNIETLEPEHASDDEKKRECINDCNTSSAVNVQEEDDMTSYAECDDIEVKFTSPNDCNTPSGDTVQVEDDKLNISNIGTEQEHASDDLTKRESTLPNDCNVQSADTQQEEDTTSDVKCDDIERIFTSPNDSNTPPADTVQEEDTTSDVECEDIEIKFPFSNNGNTPSADIVQVEDDKKSDAGSDDLDSGNDHTPAKDHGRQGHEVTREILSPHDTNPLPVESAEQIRNSHTFDDQRELPEDSQVINNPRPSLFKRIKRRLNIFTGFIASQIVNAFVKNHVLL